MMRNIVISLVMMVTVFLAPAVLLTQTVSAQNANCTKNSSSFLGFPTWYKYLDFQEGSIDCDINFNLEKDIGKVLLAVFEIILRVAGLVAVGFIIYGGFQYITSQGEPETVKGARNTILNALIGMAIAISATAIVNLVARNIV